LVVYFGISLTQKQIRLLKSWFFCFASANIDNSFFSFSKIVLMSLLLHEFAAEKRIFAQEKIRAELHFENEMNW